MRFHPQFHPRFGRERFAHLIQAGAHWDHRFWEHPTLQEAIEQEQTRSCPARRVVRRFACAELRITSEGEWFCLATQSTCTLVQAAAILNVSPGFLRSWLASYLAARERPTREQRERSRAMLRRPVPCDRFDVPRGMHGWWHGDG